MYLRPSPATKQDPGSKHKHSLTGLWEAPGGYWFMLARENTLRIHGSNQAADIRRVWFSARSLPMQGTLLHLHAW